MRSDAELVEQALVIEVLAAGARGRDEPERVHPDFGSGGCELIAVVGVAGRVGDDFLRLPNIADRVGEVRKRCLSAAGEAVEVKGDDLHSAVGLARS